MFVPRVSVLQPIFKIVEVSERSFIISVSSISDCRTIAGHPSQFFICMMQTSATELQFILRSV